MKGISGLDLSLVHWGVKEDGKEERKSENDASAIRYATHKEKEEKGLMNVTCTQFLYTAYSLNQC